MNYSTVKIILDSGMCLFCNWGKITSSCRVVPREGMEALRDEEEGNKQGNFNCHCQHSEAEGGARDRSEL